MNSAGAVLFTQNGSATGLAAAARINDVTQTPRILGIGGTLTGSLFASYDASTGDITLGNSATPGASSATVSKTFSGIERSWNGGLLLASFFLRSDASLGSSWQSGDARAVFSGFRVLSGSPVAVPEPGSMMLVGIGLALVMGRRVKAMRGPSTPRL